jgi:hypothetical protein
VFVAEPTCGGTGQGPCSEALAEEGKLFAIYLEVGNQARGIHLKLRGKVEVGGAGAYSREHGLQPGQIRTSFIETPQQPFSELRLKFDGGPRAPLANPQACGTFSSTAELEPWSHQPAAGEGAGTPNVTLNPTFGISGCENKFAPAFSAGTTNPQGGAYSPFTLTFSRQDREGDLSGLTVNMPNGLLGRIAGIPLCGEAEANAGTCASASRLGTATAAAGSGSEPLWQSGPVYLTGPYNGAPFGLSVVVPAKAGPYNLGNIVVRAAIHIDPTTAAVSVISNPLPQMIDGVPLRVKTINVTIDRDGFIFNPTSCEPTQVSASIASTQGASVPVSSRFQAANCASLPFKPVLTASAGGKGSKQGGTSFNVHITSAGLGQANIAKVNLTLPKALPSRLSTIQKACVDSVFEANPASCGEGSLIGTATIHTPLLANPLIGPGYLVSHGGAAFPDVEFVLQGENVTLVLDGKTDIKKGITYSRFESAPDAPFTSFEANLPAGPHSALTADVPEKENFSLCKTSLSMATQIVGQNGAVINQATKIPTTGCPKVKTLTRAQKLKAALKACKKDKKKSNRQSCQRQARKKYGPIKKTKKTKKK